jgi:hypothetical protein
MSRPLGPCVSQSADRCLWVLRSTPLDDFTNKRAPGVVGTVVGRPVARSFKTVDSENYYGPMHDSTLQREWPKREGRMSTYVSVVGLQPHQIWGGVVARPLHGESFSVGILDFEPLT